MRTALSGAVVSVLGLCGYVVGVFLAYPGRAFSVTALMIGLTLVVIGRGEGLT
ncbi:hypothetical protein [Halorhabdus rudnickae]|uniref:hypothetical protein n=1 Tax=Halorhabdus rudnickae TaxID=1775544 RepID=UPI0014386983|nr:hypothetical protein [Halorhabdus rudnickae]